MMVLMMQGHTLDALLAPRYQTASWYNLWLYCRGLTAPAFMVLSGFSFALASVSRWEDYLTISLPVIRRMRRFGFFVLLGYAMHFPVHRFRELQWLYAEGWHSWLQVDVLQAIGVSLVLLQGLVFLCRNPQRFARMSLLGAAGAFLLAAPLWSSTLGAGLPVGVAAYFDGATGSPFPLLPFAGFVFLGAGLGTLYKLAAQMSLAAFVRRMMLGGVALVACGAALQKPAVALLGEPLFWHASPTLALVRSGIVLLVIAAAALFGRFVRISPGIVRALAAESLLVYFVHICLVYGSIWNTGLRQTFGATFGLLGASLWAVTLIVVMLALALLWNRFKQAGQPAPVIGVKALVFAAAVGALM